MSTDTKTPEQLRREIAYFRGIALRTASRDRLRRAHAAIKQREQQLQAAQASARRSA